MAAHLRYAVLRVASMYPEGFSTCDVVIDADINTTLDAITPKFFPLFRSHYAGKRYSLIPRPQSCSFFLSCGKNCRVFPQQQKSYEAR